MNVLLDILSASFVGGIILLMILKLNIFMSNTGFLSDNELQMQQNAKTHAEIINYDFRKIGYRYNNTAMITAEKKKIKFVGDLQRPGETGFGNIDTLEYFVLDSTYATGTTNPRDIILVRVLNNKDTLIGGSLGLVDINFSYLDSLSSATADLSKIKYIKTELWLEPFEQANNFITGKKDSVFTYWEFTIHPRNI
jgi:hypothetical protein